MKTLKLLYFALMLVIGALALPQRAIATVLVEQVLVNTERELISTFDDSWNYTGTIDSYHWQAEIYILDDAEGYLWIIWETPGGYIQETWVIGPGQSYWTKVSTGYTGPSSAWSAVINYLYPPPPPPPES